MKTSLSSRLLINFILFIFLNALSSSLKAQPKADPLCLASQCGGELLTCGLDQGCRQWLQCVLECGEDKIRCPSVCGFLFQGKTINTTSQCIFQSHCVDLGFDNLGHYEHQAETPLLTSEGLEGTWWFAGSYGGDHIFDFDCQRFDFQRQDPLNLRVRFSVPLTYRGDEKLTGAQGQFKVLRSGALEVAYDNFAGYHEHWYLVDRTPSTLLAHVCIANQEVTPARCYDYGTILLARQPLSTLHPQTWHHLDSVTTRYFGFEMSLMRPSGIGGCPQI